MILVWTIQRHRPGGGTTHVYPLWWKNILCCNSGNMSGGDSTRVLPGGDNARVSPLVEIHLCVFFTAVTKPNVCVARVLPVTFGPNLGKCTSLIIVAQIPEVHLFLAIEHTRFNVMRRANSDTHTMYSRTDQPRYGSLHATRCEEVIFLPRLKTASRFALGLASLLLIAQELAFRFACFGFQCGAVRTVLVCPSVPFLSVARMRISPGGAW